MYLQLLLLPMHVLYRCGLPASLLLMMMVLPRRHEGERLDEDGHFSRYPDGQGRYVAVIDEQLPILPLVSLLQDDQSALKLKRMCEPTDTCTCCC